MGMVVILLGLLHNSYNLIYVYVCVYFVQCTVYGDNPVIGFRPTRGSDYSPAVELSEQKDKLVTENWRD